MRRFFITLAIMLLVAASNVFAQGITKGKAINLGLPSGTIWAAWNVGATSPEQLGDHYAWGETEEKSDYSMDTYKYFDPQTGKLANIGTNISGTQYDVARQKWGGTWRMPTAAEFDELASKCTWTWYEYKGVVGYKVIGPNGNSIFLPAAAFRDGKSFYIGGGSYWSASLDGCRYYARRLYFDFDSCGENDCNDRYIGFSVRPVK